MTYLRDIGRQTPDGTLAPIENWLLGPVEFAVYKQLRKLKIDTGIKLSKINILGTSNPEPYQGDCFDGCTEVQLDINWSEIACLPRESRVERALSALAEGICIVLNHFGTSKSGFNLMIQELKKNLLETNIKLASFQSGNEKFLLVLFWKSTIDFAQLRVSKAAAKDDKFLVIATMWPDFDGIKPSDIQIVNGQLQVKCYAGFFFKTLLGRKYLEPITGIGQVSLTNENKSAIASFDIDLIAKELV